MFRRVFEINTFGTAVATDVFLPLLKKSKTEGGSRIINLSSGLASIGLLSDPKGPMTGSGYPIVNYAYVLLVLANLIYPVAYLGVQR